MLRLLLTYSGILIAWTVYRVFYRFSEPVDELVVKPLVFVVPVLWYLGKFEKRKWEVLKLQIKNLPKSLYISFGLGALLLGEGLFLSYLRYGKFHFQPVLPVQDYGLAVFFGLSLVTAFSEEIFGRGFLYQQFKYYVSGSLAIVYSSLLFTLIHLPIALFMLQLGGMTLLIYLASILILSMANCLILRFSDSLLAPILVHAFWVITIGLYL